MIVEQAKQDLANFMDYVLPSKGTKCLDIKRNQKFILSVHCLVLYVYFPNCNKFFDDFMENYSEYHKLLSEDQLIVFYAKIRKLSNTYFNHYKKKSKNYIDQLDSFQKKVNLYFSEENCRMLLAKVKQNEK